MSRILARVSIVATTLFLVIILALLFLAPEVDPLQYGISFYGLTDFSAVFGLAVALVSLSAICLGIGLWPNLTSAGGRIGAALLISWGVLSMPASVFPLDQPGSAPTLAGTIHNIAGLSFLLAIPAVLFLEFAEGFLILSPGGRRATYWLASLVPVSALLLFTFNGPFSSLGVGGLIQRFYWVVFTAWLVLKAAQLLPSRPPASA